MYLAVCKHDNLFFSIYGKAKSLTLQERPIPVNVHAFTFSGQSS